MRQFVIITAFSLCIILLYRVYPMRIFSLDVSQKVTSNLFNNLKDQPGHDSDIIILNSGALSGSEIKKAVDHLLTFNPDQIAILVCDIDTDQSVITEAYKNNPTVFLAECSGKESLARVVYDDNVVTHFKTDNLDYLELKLANAANKLKDRTDKLERINYYGAFPPFFHHDLSQLDQVNTEIFYRSTILIGYCGKNVSNYQLQYDDENRDYAKAHITPLNKDYEFQHEGILPDMYDVQIVANIVKMIREDNFLNEAANLVRIGFMLICSLILVALITLIQTRWLILNLVIYAILFYIFLMGGTFLIVYCFTHDYYLNIPEYDLVLLFTGVFTILYNLFMQKKKARQA